MATTSLLTPEERLEEFRRSIVDVADFNERVVGAYNTGAAEKGLPADSYVARSIVPAGTGALEQAHQDGLRLVVGRVAEGDALGTEPIGGPGERGVSRRAGHLLGRPPPAERHRDALDRDRAVEAGRQLLDEGRVPVGFGTKTVMDVADAEGEVVLGSDQRERVEERGRVGTAGDGYEDAITAAEELVADDGGAQHVQQGRRPRAGPVTATIHSGGPTGPYPAGGDSP